MKRLMVLALAAVFAGATLEAAVAQAAEGQKSATRKPAAKAGKKAARKPAAKAGKTARKAARKAPAGAK